MSSSPESGAVVLDGATVTARSLPAHELRSGTWTRLGGTQVLGDAVTEHTLSGLIEETRSAARAQGYSTGWAEGRRAAEHQARDAAHQAAEQQALAEQRREAEHRAACENLARAAADFARVTAEVCAQVEDHTLALAAVLTEELLGHELAVATHPGLDAVRRALALAPRESVARIRVSAAEGIEAGLAELVDLNPTVVVIADPALRRGEAVVEADRFVVDARVSGAMERVRAVLLEGAAT